MTGQDAAGRAEELAKRLAVAWWSAEGVTKGHPEANNALWFATENVEMWWQKATEQRPFFLAMATVLLPVLDARTATALAEARRAERERCYRIACSFIPPIGSVVDTGRIHRAGAAQDIAAAIRRPPDGAPGEEGR